jgi:hypothetical protein
MNGKNKKLVASIYDYLVEQQLSVWMNIRAGISLANIYEEYQKILERFCLVLPYFV